jgi:hypothetical protein
VEITYHGQTLGVVHPAAHVDNTKEQEQVMAEFFGMHRESGVNSVEDELRLIRKGRRSKLVDL